MNCRHNIFVKFLLLASLLIGTVHPIRFLTYLKYKHRSTDTHLREVDEIIDKYAVAMTLAGPDEKFEYTVRGRDGESVPMAIPMFEHAKNVMEVAIFYRRLLEEQHHDKLGGAEAGGDEGGMKSFRHKLDSHAKPSTKNNALKKIKADRANILDRAIKGTITLADMEHWHSSHGMVLTLVSQIRKETEAIKQEAIRNFAGLALKAMKNYAKASNAGMLNDAQIQAYTPVLQQFKKLSPEEVAATEME